MHKSAMKRWKFTVAPPHVCDGCYWRARAHAAQESNKKLRLELLKKRHVAPALKPKKTKEPAPPPEDEDDITPADPDVLDVVEQIKRSRGED